MEATGARHILVVEDNTDYRRRIVSILRKAGFGVTEAAGFGEAMTAIEGRQEFALLLSDIGMPAGTPHGYTCQPGRATPAATSAA